jgi:methylenetetrahydrofolate dehydrogenase (NADP+)/methenyltetrahydrofolate cyclohydrolase
MQKTVVVLGKGETAGKPIANYLTGLGLKPITIDSKTENAENMLKEADIVISAVGKSNVVNSTNLKQDAILIGVGMHKDTDGLFRGDYDEKEVSQVVSFYTPTPGGVGPLNVVSLFENLVLATENSSQ